MLLTVFLALLLGACQGDRTSTAGSFSESGVSTAGPFDDGTRDRPAGPDRQQDAAALLAEIDRDHSPDRTLGYARARDALYAWADATGGVCTLYTGWCVRLGTGDPSKQAGRQGINAEHVWPQSKGARAEPLRSDLHHLFPERETVNSSRGNLPFGEVTDARAEAWYTADLSQSNTPAQDAGAWSERGDGRWEPREDRKGDVARALFYVQAVYPDQADPSFFPPMRETLLAWNRADPPDAAERARSAWVAGLQGTENPFVLDPTLADQVWGGGAVPPTASGGSNRDRPASDRPPGRAPRPSEPLAALSVSEVHYDNAGPDVGEGIEVAGPDGAALDGWRLALVNGNGGAVYQTVPLTGRLDGGAAWVPIEGLQNGSPDGVALVDPSGRTVEALAWEGAFTGADGTRFRDIGVAETASVPPGTSLQRVGGRWVAGRPASPGRPNR